jgi:hypothetical protein
MESLFLYFKNIFLIFILYFYNVLINLLILKIKKILF